MELAKLKLEKYQYLLPLSVSLSAKTHSRLVAQFSEHFPKPPATAAAADS